MQFATLCSNRACLNLLDGLYTFCGRRDVGDGIRNSKIDTCITCIHFFALLIVCDDGDSTMMGGG